MSADAEHYAVPILPVRDVRSALLGYRALGFTARIDDDGDYGFLRRGGIRLHLAAIDLVSEEFNPATCYVYTENADALAEEWIAADAPGTVERPEDRPWTMREGTYTDADGNVIRFGSRLPVR